MANNGESIQMTTFEFLFFLSISLSFSFDFLNFITIFVGLFNEMLLKKYFFFFSSLSVESFDANAK